MREGGGARIRVGRVVAGDHALRGQRGVDACAAKTEIVSMERQAGTMPRAETLPMVGFSPTMLPNAAGTRPEPAVSVPSAKATIPAATAAAEPDDEPPGTCAASNTLRGMP